jgi:hypothetical protein
VDRTLFYISLALMGLSAFIIIAFVVVTLLVDKHKQKVKAKKKKQGSSRTEGNSNPLALIHPFFRSFTHVPLMFPSPLRSAENSKESPNLEGAGVGWSVNDDGLL